MQLFDYQELAMTEVRGAYAAGFRAPLLVLPTGGGKTVCFTYMAKGAADKGLKVLLLAHRRELISQISKALHLWEVPHGMISPQHKPTSHGVQVAMAQTLARRLPMDKAGRFKFDLVIIDECHHATLDSQWGAILEHNQGARFLGVSATPCRLDGKGLGKHADGFFDSIIVGPSVQELIDRGRLCKPVIYQPDIALDDRGIKKRGGDYSAKDLAAATGAEFTEASIQYYRKLLAGAPSIAFTCTVDHSALVVEAYKKAGYSAAVLSGSTPDRERAEMIRDLGAGKLNLLASCDVISEGTDIPTVMGAVLLRKTKSYALAMQQIGRALRVLPGKDTAIVLDLVGNTLIHGDPTEPVEWSLDGMRKNSKGDGRVCGDCRAVIPYGVDRCPGCGKAISGGKVQADQGQQDSIIFQKDINLVELTPAKREEWRLMAERNAKSKEDFQHIANQMGYTNPRWAEHRMRMYERGRGA